MYVVYNAAESEVFVRLLNDMISANLGVPMALFAAYLLFILVGAKLRFRMFEPKEVPRKQEKPAEASVPVDFEAEVA